MAKGEMSFAEAVRIIKAEQEARESKSAGSGREVLELLMEKEGKRPGTVAVASGISRQSLGVMLKRNKTDIPASALSNMLGVLGYELVVVKRGEIRRNVGIRIE